MDRQVHYIDPMCFLDLPDASELCGEIAPVPASKPSLYCIGRTERLKGNDLFIELVRWIKPELFSEAAHIGKNVTTSNGIDSRHILQNTANTRGISVPFFGSMSRQELRRLYTSRAVVILPVRYDTLNLVALEALFSGCPVAVSSKAGVCEYLDENFPALPYEKIDFDNFYACVPLIERILSDYDAYRKELASRVAAVLPGIQSRLDMEAVYRSALAEPVRDPKMQYSEIRYRARPGIRRLAASAAHRVLPIEGCRRMQTAALRQLMRVKRVLRDESMRRWRGAARLAFDIADIGRRIDKLARSQKIRRFSCARSLGIFIIISQALFIGAISGLTLHA